MNENLLRIEEVASNIKCSIYTINNWYKFKKLYPENELAKLLPDYIQANSTSPRYWNESDVEKLLRFKEKRTLGRYGVMGKITQKYVKKGEK